MDFTATQEIIRSLKSVKEKQNLSISQIKSMVDATGAYISMTTIRRVFADESETADSFNYEQTLRPIAQALLHDRGLYTEDELALAKYETYEAINRHKDEVIESLHKQIEALRDEHDARCKECEKRQNFLMDQIALKDKRMERKDAIIDKLLPYALQGNDQK